jgi:hypothetical protein
MNIRSAYPDLFNPQKDFTRTGNWLFNFVHYDLAWLGHHSLSHIIPSTFFSICQRVPAPETSITLPQAVKSPVRIIVFA